MKTCTQCRNEKTFAEFGRLKSSKDKYRRECRECRKKYYLKPPNEIEEWKKWRTEHMRKLGVASRGRKVSQETKVKKEQTDAERWKKHDYTLAAKKRNYYHYRKKGLDCSLEEFVGIVTTNCFYCGCEPNVISGSNRNTKHGVAAFKHLGIDRVDNLKGYTKDNVVPCCWRCNNAKWTYEKDDFLHWVSRIYKKSRRRKK